MARGTVLTKDVKALIAEVFLEHPDWRTKKIWEEVIKRLHLENPYVDTNWPGLSAVQKELTKMRRRHEETPPESKGLDRPWSIGTLTKYDITPEALPKVLQVQEQFKAQSRKPLTIRQARWIGRLHALTTDINELGLLSSLFASRERISEIASVVNDTPGLDNAFRTHTIGSFAFLELAMMIGTAEDRVPDSYKKTIREDNVPRMERTLGLTLDPPDFTNDMGWFFYAFSLMMTIEKWDWSKLSKKELEKTILRYRDAATRASSATGTIADRLCQMVIETIEEEKNERSHSQEVQE